MLRCQNVSVALAGIDVVRDVTVDVGANEWLGVIGPNGAGKSTFLRALAGLVSSRGGIEIGEQDGRRLGRRAWARAVALVPQDPVIPDGMRVVDYVTLGRTPHHGLFGAPGHADVEIVEGVLADLQLDPFARRNIASLSGGERQRVFLARALAQQAPVLLLDEPTSALDIGHQQDVLGLIDSLRSTRSLCIVSAVHDLTIAAQYADRLLLLYDGAVVASGTSGEVLTESVVRDRFGATVRILHDDEGVVVVPVRARRVAQ
ncbi:MAG: ABC transporter ATP-binding protein [Acidimicrobiia bacterium]